jgi:hypothetical protein
MQLTQSGSRSPEARPQVRAGVGPQGAAPAADACQRAHQPTIRHRFAGRGGWRSGWLGAAQGPEPAARSCGGTG